MFSYMTIDDDLGIGRMLRTIIDKHDIGIVLGTFHEPIAFLEAVEQKQPNVAIVDLLLPTIDGIALTREVKLRSQNTLVVMISEVNKDTMIARAYDAGIEFFIQKPINVVEVISVLGRVNEKLEMQGIIRSFRSAFHTLKDFEEERDTEDRQLVNRLDRVLFDLGLSGETGTQEIREIILYLVGWEDGERKQVIHYKLNDLYEYLREKALREEGSQEHTRTIEQRIRRVVVKALSNIAQLGLEDYTNDHFTRYASSLFDFLEVRKHMDYLKGNRGQTGKVNIKKFIEGLVVIVKHPST